MAEFNGRSLLTVDAKGRLFLPQSYRDTLGSDFVISLSSDLKTLAFYCKEDWDRKSDTLRRIPETDRRAHRLLRLIFSSTFAPYNADAQGRVLIPQAVRQDYALTEGSEVVLVGVGSNLEIWNAERFRSDLVSMTEAEEDESLDYVYDKYFSASTDINERKAEQ
ncbi:MAG: division/cell wall cluster transcriptional repressor MraZ [Clostridia bacterium]|nr:division/cell wall cluster transcriptional repressor MraZ [Clostridia bacterium]